MRRHEPEIPAEWREPVQDRPSDVLLARWARERDEQAARRTRAAGYESDRRERAARARMRRAGSLFACAALAGGLTIGAREVALRWGVTGLITGALTVLVLAVLWLLAYGGLISEDGEGL